jgi:hypothetical protein
MAKPISGPVGQSGGAPSRNWLFGEKARTISPASMREIAIDATA